MCRRWTNFQDYYYSNQDTNSTANRQIECFECGHSGYMHDSGTFASSNCTSNASAQTHFLQWIINDNPIERLKLDELGPPDFGFSKCVNNFCLFSKQTLNVFLFCFITSKCLCYSLDTESVFREYCICRLYIFYFFLLDLNPRDEVSSA